MKCSISQFMCSAVYNDKLHKDTTSQGFWTLSPLNIWTFVHSPVIYECLQSFFTTSAVRYWYMSCILVKMVHT